MARPSSVANRNLSLVEQLESLEQSITLTLQEIDHNFSRAHRIVTTSILPIVEQYGKHSEAVWDGSKFWSQFFQASANVALTGYEEGVAEDSTLAPPPEDDATVTGDYGTPGQDEGTLDQEESLDDDRTTDDEDALLSSPSVAHAHSTPRIQSGPRSQKPPAPSQPSFAEYPSPYETLKNEVDGKPPRRAQTHNPTTPGKGHALPDMNMTPDSSPFILGSRSTTTQPFSVSSAKQNKDTILHQGILNKTYRVAATPLTGHAKFVPRGGSKDKHVTPGTASRTTHSRWLDETLSSPDEPTPQLRAEMFSSPVRPPRTPGVSVQTPGLRRKFAAAARERDTTSRSQATAAQDATYVDDQDDRDLEGIPVMSRAEAFAANEPTSNFTRSLRAQWDSDEGEDDLLGETPARTVRLDFEMPKQAILQTPAREASRRIMEDLMLTAGAEIEEDWPVDDDDSPSIVRRAKDMDETF